MRIRLVSLPALLTLWAATIAHAAAPPTYYLALGDSLAIGIQPSANGDVATNQGYADDLFAVFRTRIPGLNLAKLGCSGETTTTMIQGGICSYPQGSQLAAAVSFIETHHVALVTLDIGANDIDHCISTSGIDPVCVETATTSVASNLPQILTELRTATGPDTLIVAMNYYDPFLAAWTLGAAGQALAKESVVATTAFNGLLVTVYQAFSVPVADVAHAYRITDFTPIPFINLPVNVFLTLSWTWMGASPPFGPDVHPNAVGYAVIAGAFVEKVAP
jgi:lysophospholipase L1-like esterase